MSLNDGYSHKDFLRDFECKLDREFEYNAQVAVWASTTSHRLWDQEDESIELQKEAPIADQDTACKVALTPDERFLGVAVNKVVTIYDVETLRPCAELPAHQRDVEALHFRPNQAISFRERAEYMLVLQSSRFADKASEPAIFMHKLDAGGRPIDEDGPLILDNAEFSSHGGRVWDGSGNRMLYIAQSGPALPHIVALNIANETRQDFCQFKRHWKQITWASWSLNDKVIATASQDCTYGLWDAHSGERKHTIVTHGPNRSGAFLSDGLHILLIGAGPHQSGIYNIETAELVMSLETPSHNKLNRRPGDFTVHPFRELILLANHRSVIAVTPFDSEEVQIILSLQKDEDRMSNSFGGLSDLKWVDQGRKLVLQGEDHTIFVWEPKKQLKWRFERPKGRAVDGMEGSDVLFVRRKESKWVISAGESRVRFWKL